MNRPRLQAWLWVSALLASGVLVSALREFPHVWTKTSVHALSLSSLNQWIWKPKTDVGGEVSPEVDGWALL